MDRIVFRFKGMRLFLFWLLSMFLSLALAFGFVFIANVKSYSHRYPTADDDSTKNEDFATEVSSR